MQDLGDKLLVKDINGNLVLVPKVNKLDTIDKFNLKASFVGFMDGMGCLIKLKDAMDSAGVGHVRDPKVVADFLKGIK